MRQIWQYQTQTGQTVRGAMRGFSDFGGTDLNYRFHRLDDAGNPVVYENGGILLDVVSGARLKAARNVTSEYVAKPRA